MNTSNIDKEAKIAYQLAIKEQRRNLAGEAVIAKSPEYGFKYALNVLRSRFIAAEVVIGANSGYAWLYASKILHNQFPEGETAIMNSEWAHQYKHYLV